MTKAETVCTCGHKSGRHHNFEECDPAYQTTSRECMFEFEDGVFCDCEGFCKDKTILKVSSDMENTMIDGIVGDDT